MQWRERYQTAKFGQDRLCDDGRTFKLSAAVYDTVSNCDYFHAAVHGPQPLG